MHAHKGLHAVAMKYQNCSQKNAFNAARRGRVCWISEGGRGGGWRGERVIDENYLEFF